MHNPDIPGGRLCPRFFIERCRTGDLFLLSDLLLLEHPPAGDARVNSGVEQELHLQPLEPAGQGFLIASRSGPGAEVDHGLGVPGVAAREPRGPAVVAMPFQNWPGRLGKRAEDGMAADPAKPVGGIAGIRLAAVSDAVPVG